MKDEYSKPKADKIADMKDRPLLRGPIKKGKRKVGLKILKDRLLSQVHQYRWWVKRREDHKQPFWKKWSDEAIERHGREIKKAAQRIKDYRNQI